MGDNWTRYDADGKIVGVAPLTARGMEMSMVATNPTREDIIEFCRNMEQSLLQANERKEAIRLEIKTYSYPLCDDSLYGVKLIDHVYTGSQYIMQVGEPAKVSTESPIWHGKPISGSFTIVNADPSNEASFSLPPGASFIPVDDGSLILKAETLPVCTCPTADMLRDGWTCTCGAKQSPS